METESTLRRYLLGDAGEQEKLRIERLYFTDDNCFQELQAVEDELMYEYLQQELRGRDRELFERRFLGFREGRRRAGFARALLKRVPAASAVTGRWRPAAAAAVLLAAFGWMWTETGRKELAVRDGPAEVAASFVLTPGATRGGSEPRRLTIQSGANLVEFQLRLPAAPAHGRYLAVVRTAAGEEVYSRDVESPAVRIPAPLLSAGDYEILLHGYAPDGSLEEAGDYYFTVTR